MKQLFKNILLFTLFINLAVVGVRAQWYKPENIDKTAFELFLKAYDFARNDQFDQAKEFINKALQMDPRFVEAYLGRADIYSRQREYAVALPDYEKAIQLDSVFTRPYLVSYANALAGAGRFEDALHNMQKFLSNSKLSASSKKSAEKRKATYEFAIANKQLFSKNYVFAPRPVSENINSQHLEYYPSFPIDGSSMVFTRRVGNNEDFYESKLIDGKWQPAAELYGNINTGWDEGAQNISSDGQMMVFAGCNYPGGAGSCDIYVAYRNKNGEWGKPVNLGKNVNTEFWESAPSLSPDKKDIYFSSNRTGGYGGKDIWVTHFNGDGTWSKPQNLGMVVNTSGDEESPFIHADNNTLYFASNGHPGYGGDDLFLSKKDEDGNWKKPVNLGYPINTIDEEGSIVVSADGKTAYYATDRQNVSKGLDIYTFQLREEIAAAKTLWVKGRVVDKISKMPVEANVVLTDIKKRKTITEVQTGSDGAFLITLPSGRDYAFNINKKGYLFYSRNFSLQSNSSDTAVSELIALQPIAKGATVALRNIFFDTKQTVLKPESVFELEKLVALMQENPSLKILIAGHTDNVGKPKDNLSLSMGRAMAVIKYLSSKGIAATRLSYKGFGETKPIAPNTTEEGRSQNRRTEMVVMSY